MASKDAAVGGGDGKDGKLITSTTGAKFTKKEREKPAGSLKLKRPAPKQTKPGNWKESEIVGGRDAKKIGSSTQPGSGGGKDGTSGAGGTSPIVNELDDAQVATFATGQPLLDDPEFVVCKHCKKPIIKNIAATHIKTCLKQKQEKAKKRREQKLADAKEKEARERGEDPDASVAGGSGAGGKDEDSKVGGDDDGDGDKIKTAKKSAVNGVKDAEDGNKKGKKRKADADAEKAPKSKKKKEEPKPKVAKPKGPVDVERQCGVPLPNGAQCARSLTCKSHSMGAKRAVPGRSLPYDMLLSAYQKKNQAKQQKAAIDANAPLQDEFENGGGPIDSDEEKDAIMAAVARSRPQPLERRVLIPTLTKYRYLRMKELVSSALVDNRGGGLFSPGERVGSSTGYLGSTGVGGGDAMSANTGMFASPVSSTPLVEGAAGALDGQSRRPSLMAQAMAASGR
ncbi:MAG: hypothetical protein M4579_006540 [Chaenotheca gracillima]|nr:MAG: hypothetical protein M4579_006540 [Chaenotheca gracillima]